MKIMHILYLPHRHFLQRVIYLVTVINVVPMLMITADHYRDILIVGHYMLRNLIHQQEIPMISNLIFHQQKEKNGREVVHKLIQVITIINLLNVK
jgi:hypothetical protein